MQSVGDLRRRDFQSRWFSDVADSPYADAINALATYGILNGDSAAFNPGGVTRSQLCALMAQALGVGYSGEAAFPTCRDRWYASAVNAMAELGFVEGTEDGTFHPDALLTYEQFTTFMSRLAAYLNLDVYEYIKDQDAQALAEDEELAAFASWAKSGVDVLARMMRRSADDSVASMLPVALEDIDPQAAVLRGEAAATLNNMLQMLGISNTDSAPQSSQICYRRGAPQGRPPFPIRFPSHLGESYSGTPPS